MVFSSETEQLVNEIEQNLERILQPEVREAFLHIPRHLFVEQYYQQQGNSLTWDHVQASTEQVYHDEALVTQIDQIGRPSSSSSQPSVMAVQLAALDIQDGQDILEIGLGTGYNAALMGYMVGQRGQVISLDIDEELVQTAKRQLAFVQAANVYAAVGDGFSGDALHAPYDRILATCSVRCIPVAWSDQIKIGGLLVCNLLTNLASTFIRVEKRSDNELRGGFLALEATYMEMHRGALPPKTKIDWRRYDSFPSKSVHLSENLEALLKNPAHSLVLQSLLPGVMKRYHVQNDQVMLYLLIEDAAVQVNDDILTINSNDECAEQQIKLSIEL